jgi:hypothetical protein
MTNPSLLRRLLIALTAVSFLLAGSLTGPPAQARTTTLTNTAHLDFLLADVSLTAIPGHTTYRLGRDTEVTMPWTYADARAGGTFERIGGGRLDPATGYYGQGAFNADDISRAAVVYLRHWRQFHDAASKTKAYELLRGLTYLQTVTGPNRGNVVLWMQSDGTLNPSADPVELPDPSDSGPSYWMARTLWALGEGYAAFADDDPQFARFLRDRLRLSVDAVQRQVLDSYGHYAVSDRRRVPSWLIINGADVTAEATLGLSAYLEAAPRDAEVRQVLSRLLEGVAAMGTGRSAWPYGAILPWAESRSMWHAWSSQMAAALARGSVVLDRPQLLTPALGDSVGFDTTLITAGGPDNAWYPTPIDRTQIAYGVDSRVQDLLATADVSRRPGLDSLAAMQASWFFGANRAGQAMYDPATGVTFDGLAADGTINRNSGAESTIHGLLTMLALDAHPAVAAQAAAWTSTPDRAGLSVVEAETADPTSGVVITPASAWTGESQYGGGALLRLDRGERATLDLGSSTQPRVLEPVSWLPEGGQSVTRWSVGDHRDRLRHRVGTQGLSAVPGALLPLRLRHTLPAREDSVGVRAQRGSVDLDAVIVRPVISEADFGTGVDRTSLLTSIATRPTWYPVAVDEPAVARSYNRSGRLLRTSAVVAPGSAWLAPGGFTVLTVIPRAESALSR